MFICSVWVISHTIYRNCSVQQLAIHSGPGRKTRPTGWEIWSMKRTIILSPILWWCLSSLSLSFIRERSYLDSKSINILHEKGSILFAPMCCCLCVDPALQPKHLASMNLDSGQHWRKRTISSSPFYPLWIFNFIFILF